MFSTCKVNNFIRYIVVLLCGYSLYQFLKKISLTILPLLNNSKFYFNPSKNNFIVFKFQTFLFLKGLYNEIQSIIRKFAIADTSNQTHFEIISIKNQLLKSTFGILRI